MVETPSGANAQVITQQSRNKWLGSKLMGTDVLTVLSALLRDAAVC